MARSEDDSESKTDFSIVLEKGAEVDGIFKDSPTPPGSNPYDTIEPIAPLAIEEAVPPPPPEHHEHQSTEENSGTISPQPSIFDTENDSLFCINRKFSAAEALMKLLV